MARLVPSVCLTGGRIERERMPMTFPDHFSDHADRYEAFRPTYPDALFAYFASLVPAHDLAWDCATGNGQAALGLTPHFDSVVATDASPQQIAQAHPHPKVTYLVAPAMRNAESIKISPCPFL
jgi:hypothetical protein